MVQGTIRHINGARAGAGVRPHAAAELAHSVTLDFLDSHLYHASRAGR